MVRRPTLCLIATFLTSCSVFFDGEDTPSNPDTPPVIINDNNSPGNAFVCDQNKIDDGSFEEAALVSNWTPTNANIVVVNSMSYSGEQSLKINATAESGSNGILHLKLERIDLSQSAQMQIRCEREASQIEFAIQGHDKDGHWISEEKQSVAFTNCDDWVSITLPTYTKDSFVTSVSLVATIETPNDTFYIDNLCIK